MRRSFPAADRIAGLALTAGLMVTGVPEAQEPRTGAAAPPSNVSIAAAITVDPADQASTLVFFNRPIVSLRARVLGRGPGERTAAAERALEELAANQVSGQVSLRPFDGGVLVQVGARSVVALTSADVDELAGQTLDDIGRETVTRMQQALAEAAEAHAPGALLRAAALASLAFVLAFAALWGLARVHGAVVGKLAAAAERTVARSGIADVAMLRASRLLEVQQRLASSAFVVLGLAVFYVAATFILRRFPFTRPWGESMRGFLLATVENFGLSIVDAMPGLFTVLLIGLIARFVSRLSRLWFDAIEHGRVRPRWIYPETAQPTRRVATVLIWLFAIVVAYPYLPGSQTEAFKGVSVFLGLMVTLGSSGLVNQMMSGLMITYSRALRVGDFVRIGDVEGTVIHLGVLSTKIRTPLSEEVTLPNTLVISQTTTDYSRFAETDGVLTPLSLTIGYDAPWRQVQALLLLAAERTPGLRSEPKPLVLQASLDDFYVKYTLLVALERQQSRLLTLHALRTHIQDLFNEYGVQIMSPNYVLDPAAPKVVTKKDWYAAPARADADVEAAKIEH